MIYFDGTHLVSNLSQEELHEFAQRIGLKRSWYQPHKKHPHYDILSKSIANKAIKNGAKMVSSKALVELIKEE